MAEENWLRFSGDFMLPASLAGPVLANAIPLKSTYDGTLVVANNDHGFSVRVVAPEQAAGARVKARMMESSE